MKDNYTESINKWKESLIIERDQLKNDIDYYTKDLVFTKKRIKIGNDALAICDNRINEADKILEDEKEAKD